MRLFSLFIILATALPANAGVLVIAYMEAASQVYRIT